MNKILLIDDDFAVRKSIGFLLEQKDFSCLKASSPAEARKILTGQIPNLIILDMNFGIRTTGEEGLLYLKELKQDYPEIPVILITAWGSIDLAVEGMKSGAADFITKPWNNDHLIRSIKMNLELSEQYKKTDVITRKELDRNYDFKNIIGKDPALLKALNIVARVSKTDATVLILGESGTGKELFAEAIHRNSLRSENNFVKVNLGGIAPTLFESEMFGHKRGAFTDARYDRKGRFGIAHRGTIFLDEIGELDPASQVKMLRVLQDRTFEILGSSETKTVDTRVICATNRKLEDLVSSGDFREDLFYRINLITVMLPALRERKSDIPLLAKEILSRLKKSYRKPDINLSPNALNWLKEQLWPGNVRELKNLLERMLVVVDKKMITVDDLREQSTSNLNISRDKQKIEAGKTLAEMEKELIISTLKKNNNNYTKTAKTLGLSRGALYRRMEKYQIKHENKS